MPEGVLQEFLEEDFLLQLPLEFLEHPGFAITNGLGPLGPGLVTDLLFEAGKEGVVRQPVLLFTTEGLEVLTRLGSTEVGKGLVVQAFFEGIDPTKVHAINGEGRTLGQIALGQPAVGPQLLGADE